MKPSPDYFNPHARRTIKVVTPCTCGAAYWYYCTCAKVVKRYSAKPVDGGVHPDDIAEVMRRHPGMDVIC